MSETKSEVKEKYDKRFEDAFVVSVKMLGQNIVPNTTFQDKTWQSVNSSIPETESVLFEASYVRDSKQECLALCRLKSAEYFFIRIVKVDDEKVEIAEITRNVSLPYVLCYTGWFKYFEMFLRVSCKII